MSRRVLSPCSVLALACWFLTVVGTAAGLAAQDHDGSERASRQLTAPMLARHFVDYLQERAPWPPEALEISSVRIMPGNVWVPQGELFIEVLPPRNDRYLGKVTTTISIRVDGVEVRRVRASAYMEAYMPVVTTTRQIRKGEVLTAEDLAETIMPISRLRGRYLDDPARIEGKAARRTMRAGQVVTAQLLKEPTVMKRGQKVMITAATDSLVVRVPGEVLEDGGIGEMVKVRNLMSKRLVVGTVMDSRTVRVHF